MAELPAHVVTRRRDGSREILLHRSMAIVSEGKVAIRRARSTVLLPVVVLAVAVAAGAVLALRGAGLPFWVLVAMLAFCVIAVPVAVMSLISSVAGAEVIADARKGTITWQQGYLGMGLGTRELVPFDRVEHLEVTLEGEQPDRWRGESDALRQFALVLVKKSGKRLTLAEVPVAANGQADGMDRTLAAANAIAGVVGTTVVIPAGWALVEIDVATGKEVTPAAEAPKARRPTRAPAKRRG